MNKGVLVGGGLGLLLLAFLAGVWLSRPAPEPGPVAALPAAPQARPPAGGAADAPAGLPASPADAPAASTGPTPGGPGPGAEGGAPPWALSPSPASGPGAPALTREQRRQARAQIRAKVNELLSKGPQLSLAETQGLLDEIEQLGQGQFDPRYFQIMRQMLQHSAQAQRLSAELNRIANSTAPKDVARRQAILGELREIGDRVANGSKTMQSYSRDLLAGQQKP